MNEDDAKLSILEEALSMDHASLVMRSRGAIAEFRGPLKLRRSGQWLTIGEETGSHLHLKAEQVHALRWHHPPDANAAIEVIDSAGEILVRVPFRGTNRNRSESCDPARIEFLNQRFGKLGSGGADG